jgi:ATP-dependent 26S proteasome regulatory subunit
MSKSSPAEDNQSELLKSENRELHQQAGRLEEKNRVLRATLEQAKEEIEAIKQEVAKLKAPPLPYGTFIRRSENPEMVVVAVDGRLFEVNVAGTDVDISSLKAGQRLLLNPAYNVLEMRGAEPTGEIGKLVDFLPDGRLIVKCMESEDHVMVAADVLSKSKLRVGDNLRFDRASNVAFEKLPKSEVEEVVLEEIPHVTYDDIGGLDEQIEQLKDAVELPYIYGHLYKQFSLKPPKGILLYGPPGCGKTLVAKAVANSLSQRIHRTLRELKEALELMVALRNPKTKYRDIAERFEKLRYEIYEYQTIYRSMPSDDIEAMYDKLDKSGILGNFIRRTEGDRESPKLVSNISDWYDLLIELKEKGYGKLTDRKRIGELLERKRKHYFIHRQRVSDEQYARNWLVDFLANNGIDAEGDLSADLARTEEKLGGGVESYFLNIKGPELLNKYVGETEYKIREVFMAAREKAQRGLPVIVFFDEMESIFRTRGSGISSDIESTIVPQFLSEIDGVESLENVIVIGASNRQDLIDPAVLRPGRLDVKIRIDRPDKEAARDIFAKYLKADVPMHKLVVETQGDDPQKAVAALIDSAVDEMYDEKVENQFLRVTYRNREQEILYFKDFSSGAMIEGIVSRAKTYAIKRTILTGERGLKLDDLVEAIRDEYKENEDLPNTTNPDDWAKISGKKGEKIVSIEPLMPKRKKEPAREVDEVAVSHRLL